jgi:hypothetical protein
MRQVFHYFTKSSQFLILYYFYYVGVSKILCTYEHTYLPTIKSKLRKALFQISKNAP